MNIKPDSLSTGEWNVTEKKYRYDNDWINRLERKLHWEWYWHQQKLMEGVLSPNDRIAEIGVGSKFTYNYLKAKGFNIVSVDIDAGKKPDILENIVSCDDSFFNFDVILAFNIFEHLPYGEFLTVVQKMSRGNVKHFFLGLPLNKKVVFEFKIRLGRYLNREWIVTLPKKRITTPNHHWELEYADYTGKRLIADMHNHGFIPEKNFSYRLQSFFHFKRDAIK